MKTGCERGPFAVARTRGWSLLNSRHEAEPRASVGIGNALFFADFKMSDCLAAERNDTGKGILGCLGIIYACQQTPHGEYAEERSHSGF